MDGQDSLNSYLEAKVNPIFEQMLTAVLSAKPDDVPPFLAEWLITKFKIPNVSSSEKDELKRLRQEVARLKTVLKNQPANSASEDSADEEDDEVLEETQFEPGVKKQRKAVSSEAYGTWNKPEDYVPRIIEKTQEQRDRILDKLEKAFMFSGLDESEREIVMQSMEERQVTASTPVISQGEDGDELFVVDSGTLDCSKVFKKGEEAKWLKEYVAGESFGELALLYNAPRAASVRAKTDCVLWVLDRSCFNNIVKGSAVRKRERYESFLQRVPLLEDMDPYERGQLADVLKSATFNAGEYVIREGDWGDIFYIIEEGEAKATKTLRPGQPPEEVKTYGPGDYFGELALLRGEPRAANVITQTEMKCVTLDRQSFKRMLGPLDDILRRNASKYPGLIKD